MNIDIYSAVGGFCIGWVIAKSSSMFNLYVRDSTLRHEWQKDIELAFSKKIPIIMNQDGQTQFEQMPIQQAGAMPNVTKPTYVG